MAKFSRISDKPDVATLSDESRVALVDEIIALDKEVADIHDDGSISGRNKVLRVCQINEVSSVHCLFQGLIRTSDEIGWPIAFGRIFFFLFFLFFFFLFSLFSFLNYAKMVEDILLGFFAFILGPTALAI